MSTITNIKLQELLQLHNVGMINRKCRIYCNNNNIEMEQYHRKGCNSPKLYDIPIDIAIAMTEGTRMNNPNRASTLKYLYGIKGEVVVCNSIERQEDYMLKVIKDYLKELELTLITQYTIGDYRLDGYIPERNIAIEIDEYHHKYYKDKDELRENIIKEISGCEILRIPEEESIGTALGKLATML